MWPFPDEDRLNKTVSPRKSAKGRKPSGPAFTRTKLILAAEKLFAARGIEAVSLREIAAAAGQGNNSATIYHFKNKFGVAKAIFTYRIQQMEETRLKLLAELEERNLLGDPRALLEVMCLPQANMVDDMGRHTYAGFTAHYQYHHSPSRLGELIQNSPALRKVHLLIYQCLSHIPREMVRLRIRTCTMMFTDFLARLDDPSVVKSVPFQAIMEDRLEMMAVALCAPYKPKRKGGSGETVVKSIKLSIRED